MTYLMLDADVVAVSPATTYRVLRGAGLLRRWNTTPSKKGQGFTQPLAPHEHWHVDIKAEGLRPGVPLSLDDGRRVAGRYIDYYNTVRLLSAIGYITPQARLEGRQEAIFAERDRKLEDARARRAAQRHIITAPLPQTA